MNAFKISKATVGKIIRGNKSDYVVVSNVREIVTVMYAKDFNGRGVNASDVAKAWRNGTFHAYAKEQGKPIAYVTKQDVGDEDRKVWSYNVAELNTHDELAFFGNELAANEWIANNGFLKLS